MKTHESSDPRTSEPTTDTANQPETLSLPPLPPPPPPAPGSPPMHGPGADPRSHGRPEVVRAIKRADIRCDAGTQIRAGISEEVVSEYAERMLAGDQFPPVDVFFDGTAYYVAVGFHRLQAAGRAKLSAFQCAVHSGTLTDALWFAIGANRKNGLPRTAADKHHAIELALTKFPEMTQERIAQHVGCSQQYVATVQKELTTSCKLKLPTTRKGKDGRRRPTKYESRKKTKAQETPPAMPLQPTAASALPASTPPTSLTGSKEDFATVVKTKFDKWMGQWAVADLPKVRGIVREALEG